MVMAVAFTRYGKLYYLDPGEHSPRVGDKVLVPTEDGDEVAECVWAPTWVSEEMSDLPVCGGPAKDEDLERDDDNRRRRAEIRVTARRLIRAHKLPMKIVGIDYVDRRKDVDKLIIIYFSAPNRVDFRELVRELASTLKARIELQQLGARDEAKIQGGVGPCGRETCCSTFLTNFEPVSVRMAKDQDLPVNPLKISGACGRLMCCLKYEHPLYQDFKVSVPSLGCDVTTEDGVSGKVVGYNVPAEKVYVRDRETGRRVACPKASVCGSRQAYEAGVAAGMRPTPDDHDEELE